MEFKSLRVLNNLVLDGIGLEFGKERGWGRRGRRWFGRVGRRCGREARGGPRGERREGNGENERKGAVGLAVLSMASRLHEEGRGGAGQPLDLKFTPAVTTNPGACLRFD